MQDKKKVNNTSIKSTGRGKSKSKGKTAKGKAKKLTKVPGRRTKLA